MELREELTYQLKRTFNWFGDTFESERFWFGVVTGLIIGIWEAKKLYLS